MLTPTVTINREGIQARPARNVTPTKRRAAVSCGSLVALAAALVLSACSGAAPRHAGAVPPVVTERERVPQPPAPQPSVEADAGVPGDGTGVRAPDSVPAGGESAGPSVRIPDEADVLRRMRRASDRPHAEAIEAGLWWLHDHQSAQGYWSGRNFHEHSARIPRGAAHTRTIDFIQGHDGPNGATDIGWDGFDVGLTGLAMLAFAGYGITHRDGEPWFRRVVMLGMNWIQGQQTIDGLYGSTEEHEYVYNHAICTMALAEIYLLSGDSNLRDGVQRAVDWIVEAQNPGMGWRYGVQPGDNDTSVTAWMVLALKSADLAGLTFPKEEVYAGANAWIDRVTPANIGGRRDGSSFATGYNAPGAGNARLADAANYEQNPSMDACAVMIRLFSESRARSDRTLLAQAQLMNTYHPRWDRFDPNGHFKIDFYYWYYAALALHQLGDRLWRPFETALIEPVLLKHQRGWHRHDASHPEYGPKMENRDHRAADAARWALAEYGSWDPVDAWGMVGGRVYATAINTLTLQVANRYPRE